MPRPEVLAVLLGLFAVLFGGAPMARAHDNRPAYLQIDEVGPGRYMMLWRIPMVSGQRMPIQLRLPDGIHDATPRSEQELADAVIERRVVEGGLGGKRIEFVWLETKRTDVLVRTQMLDGTHSTRLVQPSEPWIDIALPPRGWVVGRTYIVHGVQHILSGADHLLFVLGLILLVRSLRSLLLTVTGFTVAHSITLSLATLGIIHVPGPPVEACIALSILLLAKEILRLQQGERSLTASYPWAVAFIFGLLHGLGFAGALIDVGLPQGDVPLALLSFNCGVELGQLAFLAAVLSVERLAKILQMSKIIDSRTRAATAYGIGTLAAFWLIERLGWLYA